MERPTFSMSQRISKLIKDFEKGMTANKRNPINDYLVCPEAVYRLAEVIEMASKTSIFHNSTTANGKFGA